jgi:hypothetical protein
VSSDSRLVFAGELQHSFELVLIKLGGWSLFLVGVGESRELELPSGWSM